MKRLCLGCQILKIKEIIMWICVCPNQQMYINFKNGRKGSFSYETKASISFILMRRMCLWCPILKLKETITWILVCPNWQTCINSKNGRKRCFSYETSFNTTYANGENMFMVPNLEKSGDYYVHPYLSKSLNEYWF